jgi:glucose-6-phosphate isomerase
MSWAPWHRFTARDEHRGSMVITGPDTLAWQSLVALAKAPPTPHRQHRYRYEAAGLAVDFSYQRLDDAVLAALIDLMGSVEVSSGIEAMMHGDRINTTEQRAVLHAALRQAQGDHIGGAEIESLVLAERERMLSFAEQIRESGDYDRVVNIGIGGSDLGPAMAVTALKDYSRVVNKGRSHPKVFFVSNVDGCALADVLAEADPARTLFIVCSKTFTTQETMANAHTARRWVVAALGESAVARQFVAVSVNASAMDDFGIDPPRRFTMWDWVGGRYSVWSSIGLALAIAIGRAGFEQFLAGAREMDRHFRGTALNRNVPALMAAIGCWNINFLKIPTLAILPYTERLLRLPAYLQQLEMESNGKSVTKEGRPVGCETAPVIWGEPGNNAQHSFFQLLHQGTLRAAMDILVVDQSPCDQASQHALANANAQAQIEAFTWGQASDDSHRRHEGSRPLTVIGLDALTPHRLGALLALYEHKVFVQSLIWGINAFDQFGVELGKKLCEEKLGQTGSSI